MVLPVSGWRWFRCVGLDVLLLALLWYEYLHPAKTTLALGQWLTFCCAFYAWVAVGRRLWLMARVRKVFGTSIDHLQMPVLPVSYQCVSLIGDVLVTLTLVYTGLLWLALGYGTAVVAVRALHNPRLLSSRR